VKIGNYAIGQTPFFQEENFSFDDSKNVTVYHTVITERHVAQMLLCFTWIGFKCDMVADLQALTQ